MDDELKRQRNLDDVKFRRELDEIEANLSLRGKNALSKEEKAELKARKKEIETQITESTLNDLKKFFDYEIPMAKVNKAGITATGSKCENELIQLLQEFRAYQNSLEK